MSSTSSICLPRKAAIASSIGLPRAGLQAEPGRERARHQARVEQRREVDETDAVLVGPGQPPRHREGDRGLADAARPGDGDEALVRQVRGERRDAVGAVDHGRHRRRQIRRSLRAARNAAEARLVDARDRGDKAIAAPGNRRQVAIAAAAVAQRPPQPGDLDLEIAVLDEGVRPDPRHELALADQLAGALDQRDQDLQGAAAQTHRPAGLQQQPSRREQMKRAERDRAPGLGSRPVGRRGSILVGLEAGAKAFGLKRRQTACIGQTLVNHRSDGDHEPLPSFLPCSKAE